MNPRRSRSKTGRPLAAALAASALMAGGCAPQAAAPAGAGPPPAALSLYLPEGQEPGDAFIRRAQEGLSAELELRRAPADAYARMLRLQIAAGVVPDFFYVQGVGSPEYRMLKNDGAIRDVRGEIERYPLLRKRLESEQLKDMMEQDGLWGIPVKSSGGEEERSGLLLRADWLEKAGLSPPENTGELREILLAWRAVGSVGLMACDPGDLEFLESCYAGIDEWRPNGQGTIAHRMASDALPDAWEFMRDLYRDGLLDRQIMLSSPLRAAQAAQEGRAGAFVVPPGPVRVEIAKAACGADPDASFLFLPALEGPDGPQMRLVPDYTGLFCINRDLTDSAPLFQLLELYDSRPSPPAMGQGITTFVPPGAAAVPDSLPYYGTTVKLRLYGNLSEIHRGWLLKAVTGEIDPRESREEYLRALYAAGYQELVSDAAGVKARREKNS